jgi:hypothetical protein
MKKLFILLGAFLSITSCKGPGSGPLVRDSFKNSEQNMKGMKYISPVITERKNIAIEPCADCITIGKLLADKESYSGKVIKVKGQVTKYNPEIMGKNWVHIQDGTEFQDGFDLTITTDARVTPGEIVTFQGRIVLNKDFGYGYTYKVLMEEGKSVL